MSLLVDALSSARHLARYDRQRSAQRRADGAWRALAFRPAMRYGLPALAPLLTLFDLLRGHDGRQFGALLPFVVTLIAVFVAARPSLGAFELLRHRSRRGLVLGTLLHELPRLLWAGLCCAVAIGVSAAGAHATTAGVCALGVAFLMPTLCALRGGARRVLDRAGVPEGGRYAVIVVFILTREVSEHWIPGISPWIVAGVASLLTVGAMGRAGIGGLREVVFILLVMPLIVLFVAPDAREMLVLGDGKATTLAIVLLVAAVALALSELGMQLSHVDKAEITRTAHKDADEEGEEGAVGSRSSTPRVPLRRARAGAGLAAARLSYIRDEWMPEFPPGTSSWQSHVGRLASLGLMSVFVPLRGPILAVVAVLGSGGESGGVLVGAALLAAFWASRIGSIDGTGLDERAWLLGVDYREQVLHGLTCLLVVAAVPTIAAALIVWLVTSPDDVARHAAVLLIASAFVLRAGLVGLWPFRETHRMRIGLLLSGLAGAALAYEPVWSGDLIAWSIYVCAGVGGLGLVMRLLRLREPRLRDCVREG